MKIADLTFHGAQNYGSVLQSYALQTFVEELCAENQTACEYKILNFRSAFQKEMYGAGPASTVKNRMKRALELPYRKAIKTRRSKYEEFLSTMLHLTEEIGEEKDLRRYSDRFDVFLSGSDQIWNVRARDFSFAYLSEFTERKKISYAASLGPLDIDWSNYDKERYRKAIWQFSFLSVREEKSRNMLAAIGVDHAQIHVDPTLLLHADRWRSIQSDMNVNDGRYVLFYCLEPRAEHIRIARLLSAKTGLPVVSTGYRGKTDYFNPFIKRYDAGPKDFLSLIDHAALVLTSSFHGTAFAMIYEKPFFTMGGLRDGRIAHLIRQTHTESHDLALDATEISGLPDPVDISAFLSFERERSRQYLKMALAL